MRGGAGAGTGVPPTPVIKKKLAFPSRRDSAVRLPRPLNRVSFLLSRWVATLSAAREKMPITSKIC